MPDDAVVALGDEELVLVVIPVLVPLGGNVFVRLGRHVREARRRPHRRGHLQLEACRVVEVVRRTVPDRDATVELILRPGLAHGKHSGGSERKAEPVQEFKLSPVKVQP